MIAEKPPATSPVCLGITLGKPLLQPRFGHASIAVPGKSNEDFYGIVTAQKEPEAQTKGVAVAIADGVSGRGGGRSASETTVRCGRRRSGHRRRTGAAIVQKPSPVHGTRRCRGGGRGGGGI